MARHPLPVRRLVLPPIRTLTVGIGVSPIQPQGRTSRVADCHRRFGFSPTPEHVCLATSMPLRGMDVHHGGRTWLSPRGDSTWRSRWGTRSGHTHHGSSGTEQQIYHGLHSDGLLSPRTWHWMRGQELEEGSGKDRGLTGRDRKDQGPAGSAAWRPIHLDGRFVLLAPGSVVGRLRVLWAHRGVGRPRTRDGVRAGRRGMAGPRGMGRGIPISALGVIACSVNPTCLILAGRVVAVSGESAHLDCLLILLGHLVIRSVPCARMRLLPSQPRG